MSFSFYTLVFTVPAAHKDAVVNAVLDADAGHMGNYDRAYTEIKSLGHFRPLEGAKPAVGEVGKEEVVDEVRIEVPVPKSKVAKVTEALLKAHPYEMPAYCFLPSLTSSDVTHPKGDRIGTFVSLGFILLLFAVFFLFFTRLPAEDSFIARFRSWLAEKAGWAFGCEGHEEE